MEDGRETFVRRASRGGVEREVMCGDAGETVAKAGHAPWRSRACPPSSRRLSTPPFDAPGVLSASRTPRARAALTSRHQLEASAERARRALAHGHAAVADGRPYVLDHVGDVDVHEGGSVLRELLHDEHRGVEPIAHLQALQRTLELGLDSLVPAQLRELSESARRERQHLRVGRRAEGQAQEVGEAGELGGVVLALERYERLDLQQRLQLILHRAGVDEGVDACVVDARSASLPRRRRHGRRRRDNFLR